METVGRVVENVADVVTSWCEGGLGGRRRPRDELVPFSVNDGLLLSDKLLDDSSVPPAEDAAGAGGGGGGGARAGAGGALRRDQILLERKRREAAEASASGGAPSGPRVTEWMEMQDTETGRLYYHNAVTGKSRWDKPPGFDEAFEIAEARAKQDAAAGTSYWIQVSDSKGRLYYYDLISRQTSWVCPPGYYEHDENNHKLNAL